MSLILFEELEINEFAVSGELPGKARKELGTVKKSNGDFEYVPIKSVKNDKKVRNIKTKFTSLADCEKHLEKILILITTSRFMNFLVEVPMEEGFEIASQPKESRLVRGKAVSLCSGVELFRSLRGTAIKCWKCGCEADRWITTVNHGDNVSQPVLNLFALRDKALVMMTRDHIIPKSVGGMDSVENLRPACEACNGDRGNILEGEELAFALAHPELIHKERQMVGLQRLEKNILLINDEEEIKKLRQPFIALGIIALA